MRRRTAQGLAAVGAAAVVIFLGAGVPRSATVEIDDDGGAWETSLEGPLFDEDIRWVPGDTRTAEFKVRNGTGDDGIMSIHVDGPNSVVADVFSVGLGGAMAQCAEVAVAADTERNVVATVHMDDSATDETQKQQAELDVVLQWGDGGVTSPCVPSFDDAENGER